MIRVETDKRTRLVSSVMLLTRFVDENPGWKPHALKLQTQEHLKGSEDHPCAVASRELAESWFMCSNHSFAIMMDWAPGRLALREDARGSMEAFESRDYARLLDSFYRDAGLEAFWTQTANQWGEVEHDCREIIRDSRIEEFYDLFFGPSEYPLVLVPNPLDPVSYGFGPNDGTTAYCIVGVPNVPPGSRDPVAYRSDPGYLRRMAFHEFAHSLFGDLHTRCPDLTQQTAHLDAKVQPKGWFADRYDAWEIRLDEILIRATTALFLSQVEGEESARASLQGEVEQHGLEVVVPIYELLQAYLDARKHGEFSGLADYVPTLCAGLAQL